MSTKFKILLTAAASLFVMSSCESIKDDYTDCGVWLEFVFDYNMEYADSFDPQVKTVDVYIFDKENKFVLSQHVATADMDGRKRIFLGNDLGIPFGEYKVLTAGNLSAAFSFTDKSGKTLTEGVTSMEEVELALKSAYSSQQFDHLYFSKQPVEINYKPDLSVWKLPLVRETNQFNIVLKAFVDSPNGLLQGPAEPIHGVEIVAPESGAYNYLNNPVSPSKLVYEPYFIQSRIEYTESDTWMETAAKINTMRLLENEWTGYRIIVRQLETTEVLYSNDLLPLLANAKPDRRADGTYLPMAEYLDRQGDWEIVVVYKSVENEQGGDPPTHNEDYNEAFVALSISVNGWIVWQHGVGV